MRPQYIDKRIEDILVAVEEMGEGQYSLRVSFHLKQGKRWGRGYKKIVDLGYLQRWFKDKDSFVVAVHGISANISANIREDMARWNKIVYSEIYEQVNRIDPFKELEPV